MGKEDERAREIPVSVFEPLELLVPPPIVTLLVGFAMWAAASLPPWLETPPLVRWLVVGVVGVAGFAVMFAGVRAVRGAQTTISPLKPEAATTLVSSGIYARTRNPMYLGLALLLLAWAVHLAALWPFAGPLLFALYIARFQILPEERALASVFGAAYADYTRRVRRWL